MGRWRSPHHARTAACKSVPGAAVRATERTRGSAPAGGPAQGRETKPGRASLDEGLGDGGLPRDNWRSPHLGRRANRPDKAHRLDRDKADRLDGDERDEQRAVARKTQRPPRRRGKLRLTSRSRTLPCECDRRLPTARRITASHRDDYPTGGRARASRYSPGPH